MDCTLGKSSPSCTLPDVVTVGEPGNELRISFQRTVNVPNRQKSSYLPPTFGSFPLFNTRDFEETLPQSLKKKGGLMFPMYEREAMWMRFKAERPFAVKVYVGGVNAISGQKLNTPSAAMLRRLRLRSAGKSLQDYIVTPQQQYLDGIVSTEGHVRQFVAVPMGSGYSVESQLSSQDTFGGIQFEVTPGPTPVAKITLIPSNGHKPVEVELNPFVTGVEYLHAIIWKETGLISVGFSYEDTQIGRGPPPKKHVISYYGVKGDCSIHATITSFRNDYGWLFVRDLIGRTIRLQVESSDTIDNVKSKIQDRLGWGTWEQRLVSGIRQLEDGKTLSDYGIGRDTTIYLVLSMCGGGRGYTSNFEMGIAAGAMIKQSIEPDTNPPEIWRKDKTLAFNVQILDAKAFKSITGVEPPDCPFNSPTNKPPKLPFFKTQTNSSSRIVGDFDMVKPIGNPTKQPWNGEWYEDVVLLENWPSSTFRGVAESQEAVDEETVEMLAVSEKLPSNIFSRFSRVYIRVATRFGKSK